VVTRNPHDTNDERERHSVNAPESARRRGGDEMVRLPKGEKLRRVFATGKSFEMTFGSRPPRGGRELETWRTPGPAAGCNKPAKPCAEQTAEVVRNDKGGTRPRVW
jgi:hypothetical protein